MPEEKTPLKVIMNYFEMSARDFMTEWKQLNEQDKEQLRQGISSGSLNY